MKKILLLAVFISIHFLGLKALASDNIYNLSCTPTITTGTISPITICAGTVISVPFTFTDCVDPSNVFTVQLSDAAGSFASPVNIGSAAGTTAGSIIAIVPPNISFGFGYRIRVVSSSPLVNGTDNGVDLTLLPKPNATFSINNSSQCVNGNSFVFTNTSTGSISNYKWNLGDGITTTQTNVAYSYASSNNYNVTLTATGTNGCRDSITQPVTVL
ncbi:MAG: PKD domain-containing protein, partial [Chitinophagaceae bacterium]